jgi:hypothetical protein
VTSRTGLAGAHAFLDSPFSCFLYNAPARAYTIAPFARDKQFIRHACESNIQQYLKLPVAWMNS